MTQIMTYGSQGQCIEICGKGANYGLLDCDDGNTKDNDGCSANCKVEPGYICSGGTMDSPDFCQWISYDI
jgi:cysteine-rich repeat protein